MVFTTNIENDTVENRDYRRVVHTGKKMQLVLMSLKPGEEIPTEVHRGTDQFIRIEKGTAQAIIDGKDYELKDDDCIIIPSGKEHRIVNTSETQDVKLYSIYADPEHPEGTVHKRQADADAAEDHEPAN